MTIRLATAAAALFCVTALATPVRSDEIGQTAHALHNYGHRKKMHMHNYVHHRVAHVQNKWHRKAHRTRQWLNTH